MNKVAALIRKEWQEVFQNRFVLFTVSFLPLMMTGLPLVILYFTGRSGELNGASLSDLPPGFASSCGELAPGGCFQYFIVTQFILLFMIVPVIIPITFASYSIVGEKTTRTLEPLLATPVTTLELLAGKGLAAALPAVGATWAGYLLFVLGVYWMEPGSRIVARLFDPLWAAAVFLVGPLLAGAGVSIAVMISSRVNEPRVAEQISGLFVLPVIVLFIGQTTGLLLVNAVFILWMALALLVLDGVLIAFAVQLFQRETILSRWK
jgi:ABC-2 type transport system permease protein